MLSAALRRPPAFRGVRSLTPPARRRSDHPSGSNSSAPLSNRAGSRRWPQTPLHAKVSGFVKAWHKDIGDTVEAGTALAEISDPELEQELIQKQAGCRADGRRGRTGQEPVGRIRGQHPLGRGRRRRGRGRPGPGEGELRPLAVRGQAIGRTVRGKGDRRAEPGRIAQPVQGGRGSAPGGRGPGEVGQGTATRERRPP